MQWVKIQNNIALRYIQNKEYELVYVVHRKSISLRDSFRSKKFVYSESLYVSPSYQTQYPQAM